MNFSPLKKKGTHANPSDFIKQPRKYMSVEEAASFMDSWAAEQNKAAAERAEQ